METQPSLENPDDHQEQETLVDQVASSTHARSYECNFCKRGFSNAQALGGHMNIHRKHKANLVKPSSNIDHHSHQQPLAYFSNISSGDGRPDHSAKDFKITGNYVAEIQQLPLFDDKPSSTVLDNQQKSFEAHSGSEKGYDMSSSETLDLELRLGHEPQDSAPSSSMGTKKFF